VNAAQAEKRYYELYKQFMAVHVGPYSKPIVQKEIRTQAWETLLAEIELEMVKTALLPVIEQDAACQIKP
jgi:hypothetical protein